MTRNVAYLLKSGTRILACVVSLVFALSLVPLGPVALQAAIADEGEGGGEESEAQKTAYELQQQIASAQETYEAAQTEVDRVNEDIDETRERIAELEREIPAQQERSARAARELYKIQQEGVGVIDLLLSAGSFSDFLAGYEYVNYVTDANVREMNRLNELKAEIDAQQQQLEQAYAEASSHVNETRAALDELEEAQAEVQRRIEEEARQQAEIAAQAAALAEQERTNDQVAAGEDSSEPGGGDAEGSSGGGEAASDQGATASAPAPVASSADEAAFLAEWGPRIDAYLAGSPLAGQGATFAHAAYTYNVDPRWSPAISFTESGKGQYCFLSHNAWGWGAVSWDSWEEAIDAHVRGLSRGYGYTISEEAAKKYCPPNWQNWYNRTSEQMNLI